MSAHTLVSTLAVELQGSIKKAIVTITGTTSYDTNGSVLDLSSIFPSKVWGVRPIGVSAHASDKYLLTFVPGASYSPSTGTIKVRNALIVTTGTPGSLDEVASTTDLHTTTWTLEVTGA